MKNLESSSKKWTSRLGCLAIASLPLLSLCHHKTRNALRTVIALGNALVTGETQNVEIEVYRDDDNTTPQQAVSPVSSSNSDLDLQNPNISVEDMLDECYDLVRNLDDYYTRSIEGAQVRFGTRTPGNPEIFIELYSENTITMGDHNQYIVKQDGIVLLNYPISLHPEEPRLQKILPQLQEILESGRLGIGIRQAESMIQGETMDRGGQD